MRVSDIEASLEYGRLITGSLVSVLYLFLVSAILLLVCAIVMVISALIGALEWDHQKLVICIGLFVLGVPMTAVAAHIIKFNKNMKKKIVIWMEDAIEIVAYSKKVDEIRLGLQPKTVKICVSFLVENKKYTVLSNGIHEGYHSIFSKYSDREIRILYSKKYNQVMILKNEDMIIS